ncbi:type 1 glutamine amidotransferase domain-containing protein [Bradyrhizobium sp. STM 3557]|uniref:type 1 glutamine amidotransferase domain-containing protein n=1 Tax=Bradyrhizobium sp. STM 3557 TaxID=578920 RepID=UPI003890EDFB
MRILVVLTSHDRLASGRRTGVCLKSFALGYYACVDAGLEVTICSPLGGPAPIAPCSDGDMASGIVQRFLGDRTVREEFSDGLMLSQVCAGDFSAVYYPDGPGALWDLPGDRDSQALICQMHEQRRPCAFIGHGTAALLQVCKPDTMPLVAGRRLMAPGRDKNAAVGLPDEAPSLEQELDRLGAICVTGAGVAPVMVEDGGLITGRDADASVPVVQSMLAAIQASA